MHTRNGTPDERYLVHLAARISLLEKRVGELMVADGDPYPTGEGGGPGTGSTGGLADPVPATASPSAVAA